MGKYTHEKETFSTKKALSCQVFDLEPLGIEHTLLNINLPALMWEDPPEDAIAFECQGRTWWFDQAETEKIDQLLQSAWEHGVAATAILLNSPRLFDSHGEEALLKKVIHPDFDWQCEDTFISAFSVNQQEGRRYYQAFVEFLSQRYMRDDGKYGRITGFIVSNEVNSQYVWGNAGDKSVEDYAKEYTDALYVTWQASHKYWEGTDVFLSLDHFWQNRYWSEQPTRTYAGRDLVELVNDYSEKLGGFGWGIAYHPYPEDLRYPDFYHDRQPTFYFDTPVITFKNMEVLDVYMAQKHLLYQGQKRPIVFSEQGFNSGESEYTEHVGAAAYVLAYQKMKKLNGIRWMTHHAYVDNPMEFGLNLGIYRRNDDGTLGRPKPIYEAMKAMGTEQETQMVDWARQFVGAPLYDWLVEPEVHFCEEDKSKEKEFGNT